MKATGYRWLPWVMIALGLAGLLITLLVAGAQPASPAAQIDRWEELSSAPRRRLAEAELTIAIAPVVSALPSIERYRPLVSLLGERLEMSPHIVQRESYAGVNRLVAEGDCDVAFICTYAYVLGREAGSMELLVIPQIEGRTVYHGEVYVPVESDIRSLADCLGRRFASADRLSNTGWIYPAAQLRALGHDPQRAFSEHLFSGSHDKSIEALLRGRVDAAAVDAIVWDEFARANPERAKRYRSIHRSPDFGMPPLVHRVGMEPRLVNRIRAVLLQMHESEAGRAALREAGIDRFVGGDEAAYEGVAALAREHRRGDPR